MVDCGVMIFFGEKKEGFFLGENMGPVSRSEFMAINQESFVIKWPLSQFSFGLIKLLFHSPGD